ncbi:MAG: integral rane protein-like protein [Sphingomonas bacterium]|nr:integral rane protein-like protein [Sphingomonas bacterium]
MTIERSILVLTLLCALGAAVVGGFFFAFSTMVMRALGALPASNAVAAMQSINVVAVRCLLMPAMFGTALACLILGGASLVRWGSPGAPWLLAGCAIYLIGVVGVTMAFNVPLNDTLAAVDPTSAAAAELWRGYLPNWTAWNHVRTVTGVISATALVVAAWLGRIDLWG